MYLMAGHQIKQYTCRAEAQLRPAGVPIGVQDQVLKSFGMRKADNIWN